MRPSDLARRGADYLSRHGVASPRADAEALLGSIMQVDRAALYLAAEPLRPSDARALGRALCARASGVPLQHLTGVQAFRGLLLRVRPGVFIPRPETEILVDEALARLDGVDAPRVVDTCTGSGAVALAIASECPAARVIAIDASPDAVSLAAENAAALGLSVEIAQGDLLEPAVGPLDLVTCNPPYVPIATRDALPPDVAAEPALALFGDPSFVGRLCERAMPLLRPGGWVVVEIEESTADAVCALATRAGFVDARVRRDLAGRDRVVAARRP
jgi:release factor glutamine methyltransferase